MFRAHFSWTYKTVVTLEGKIKGKIEKLMYIKQVSFGKVQHKQSLERDAKKWAFNWALEKGMIKPEITKITIQDLPDTRIR